MSTTDIQWTDRVWNPVRGCSRVSPGCDNCYAMRQAHRFSHPAVQDPSGDRSLDKPAGPYHGLTVIRKGKVDWRGHARLVPEMLEQPLRWRKPRRIFVNSMSDLFHSSLTDEEIAAVFGVMAACPHHTFQVLTKRPERMVEWFKWVRQRFPLDVIENCASDAGCSVDIQDEDAVWPPRNVWVGVSVENQATADERIPLLKQVPAAVRFISAEPLLERVQLDSFKLRGGTTAHMALDIEGALGNRRLLRAFTDDGRRISPKGAAAHLRGLQAKGHKLFPMCKCEDFDPFERGCERKAPGLDWVIVGGESGQAARPCAEEWIQHIVAQCQKAEVPVFVKQLGAFIVSESRACETDEEAKREFGFNSRWLWRARLKDKAGGSPDEWPEDLRVRQFPKGAA